MEILRDLVAPLSSTDNLNYKNSQGQDDYIIFGVQDKKKLCYCGSFEFKRSGFDVHQEQDLRFPFTEPHK